MAGYLVKRLLRGIASIIILVAVIMLLVFSLINKEYIFKMDSLIGKKQNNDKVEYKYQSWENYGYLDYITYAEYLSELVKNGEMDQETYKAAVKFAYTAEEDSEVAAKYVAQFTNYYESKGYTVERYDAEFVNRAAGRLKQGGAQRLFAYRNEPIWLREWRFFTGLIQVDNIHYAERELGDTTLENPGITFTWYDPAKNTHEDGAVGKDVFSPAILGNGTKYKYLLYVDDQFPFIHQNLIKLKLGLSYSIRTGVDVWDTMTSAQGSNIQRMVTYPSGYTAESNVDLHSATYVPDSMKSSFNKMRFVDNYTNLGSLQKSFSKMGFSFVIGIIASFIAYFVGIPIGIWMARKKDKLVDKIGTLYIVFIIAVPSLAYIFMFRSIGQSMGLPTTFDIDSESLLIYVLPIVSLALPSIGGLMRWMRRYAIDQSNSDYVRFARSGGLSEGEIFRKHILKNAAIPIVHGIPGTVLGALVGAIITERVYTVPGTGGMLTKAIEYYDNAAIIGLTLFYASLSVVSIILGDILMAMMDPRISFSNKAR